MSAPNRTIYLVEGKKAGHRQSEEIGIKFKTVSIDGIELSKVGADLDMAATNLINIGTVDGRDLSADGTALDTHTAVDILSKHSATQISVADIGGYYAAGNVETALAEVKPIADSAKTRADSCMPKDGSEAFTGDVNFGAHNIIIGGTVDGRDVSTDGGVLDSHVALDVLTKHSAEQISVADGGSIFLSTNVETALQEVKAQADLATTDIAQLQIDVSNFQFDLDAIFANTPKQAAFTATSGQTVFDASTVLTPFTWDPDEDVLDIEVYVAGRKQDVGIHWNKTNDHVITMTGGVNLGDSVVIFKQGTSSGSGGGAGTNLELIAVDIKPDINGNRSVGSITKAWKSMFLKDTASAQVYELKVTSGTLVVTAVP